MGSARRSGPEGGAPGPGADPLEQFAQTHHAHRETLAAIEAMAQPGAAPDSVEAGHLANEISETLRLHLRDEGEDLFPLLRLRAGADRSLEDILARLSAEHVRIAALSEAVTATLRRLARRGAAPSAAERVAMRDYVAAKRRHMSFENAIVLPVARLWLTREDREDLAARIAARHGAARAAGRAEDTSHA
jgi:iron-sulfur cluster repair protein YtfE (RIC family)